MLTKELKNKIHKYISEWFKNDTVECMYCRKKLKKKDASIHIIANAVEYYHHDCYLNVKKYLWNGVTYVKVYEEEI